MIADSGYDIAYLLRRHIEVIQQTESHNSTALCVVNAVYNIADIVKISGYHSKLHLAFVIAKTLKDHFYRIRNLFNVSKGMFGIALSLDRRIGILYICVYIGILSDILISNIA